MTQTLVNADAASPPASEAEPEVRTGAEPAAQTAPAMRAARQKSGAGRIGVVGPILALALAGIGVVLLHDALSRADDKPGRSWLAAVADGLDGYSARWWLLPAGIAVALIGLWLIITALRPRSRRTVAATSQTGVFLRTRDIARLASAAADDVDGVLAAHSVAGRRKVTVTVESDAPGIADRAREAVAQRLAALTDPMTVKIRVRSHVKRREGI